MKCLTVVEETVMLAIYRLDENAYSVTIHQEIFKMTGKDVILGTLFNTLKQLNGKGFLAKMKSKPIQATGSKSVMLYQISKEGFEALEQTRKMNNKIWEQIPDVLYERR